MEKEIKDVPEKSKRNLVNRKLNDSLNSGETQIQIQLTNDL